jgi:hypothetical protein
MLPPEFACVQNRHLRKDRSHQWLISKRFISVSPCGIGLLRFTPAPLPVSESNNGTKMVGRECSPSAAACSQTRVSRRCTPPLSSIREGILTGFRKMIQTRVRTAYRHGDHNQWGAAVGYTRKGIRPRRQPLALALAEPKMVSVYALRRGITADHKETKELLRTSVGRTPSQVRLEIICGDTGAGDESVQQAAEALGARFIFMGRITQPIQTLCRHEDAHSQPTEVLGYGFPALAPHLTACHQALAVLWR